jgi:hypothetical protein
VRGFEIDEKLGERPEEMLKRLSTERAQEMQKGSWQLPVVSLSQVRKRMTQLMILSAVYSRIYKTLREVDSRQVEDFSERRTARESEL